MAEHKGNYSMRQPSFDAGDVVRDSNLEQAAPNTVLTNCADQAITFIGCKMINVSVDPAWTLENCNAKQVSRCSHLHDDYVASGLIDAEVDNCPHVVSSDEVIIDGQVVATFYEYEDTWL